ncbi:transposase [Streptomyces hawaiiensis]|uniref:transposase n=1 Tax=Streptomyces hawaiiensis TaxID=67305 RepID=UPI00364E9988
MTRAGARPGGSSSTGFTPRQSPRRPERRQLRPRAGRRWANCVGVAGAGPSHSVTASSSRQHGRPGGGVHHPHDATPHTPPHSGSGRPPQPAYPEAPRSVKELIIAAGKQAARPVQWREGSRPGTGRSGFKRVYSRFVALRIRPAGREIRKAVEGAELPACWPLAERPATEPDIDIFGLLDRGVMPKPIDKRCSLPPTKPRPVRPSAH